MKEIKFLNSLSSYLGIGAIILVFFLTSFGNEYPILIAIAVAILLLIILWIFIGERIYNYFLTKSDNKLNDHPAYYRQLTSEESKVLQKALDESSFIQKHRNVLAVSFTLIIAVLTWIALSLISSETESNAAIGTFLIMGIVFFIFYFGSFFAGSFYNKKLFMDLKAGVYKTSGHLYTSEINSKLGRTLIVKVRGMSFVLNEEKVMHGFETGDLVTIEYSPYTKILWRIYKTTAQTTTLERG